MKTLLVLRHAKSEWSDAKAHDHDRLLNARGKRDAPRMGRWMVENKVHPQVVFCSTAARAVATAKRLAKSGGINVEVDFAKDLYLAPPKVYIDVLNGIPDAIDCAMVIGHNPGLEELVNRLTGADESLPTCALARIEVEIDSWAEMIDTSPARLIALWRPKQLPETFV